MSVEPGWYADPAQADPQAQPGLRYWDGQRWTEHVAPQPGSAPGHPSGSPAGGGREHTPDGAPLAGWWHRVGASLIDAVLLIPLTVLVDLPFYRSLYRAVSDYVDRVEDASRTGAVPPPASTLQQALYPDLLYVALLGLVVSLIWVTVWLRFAQGTPGMLITGLRVRRREAPGTLSYGVILRRWAGQYAVSLVGLVPIAGLLASLYSLLDVLWAAWDPHRQTLHDKLSGTNVIRVR